MNAGPSSHLLMQRFLPEIVGQLKTVKMAKSELIGEIKMSSALLMLLFLSLD
jgi:hypothetical protein